jgi:nitrate reductase NapD
MTICSLIIHSKPEKSAMVSVTLKKVDGVEIHAITDEGKMVVSIDHPDRTHCSDSIMQMHNVDGVMNVALIYEYHEESEPTQMEVTQ